MKEMDVTFGVGVKEINGKRVLIISPNPMSEKATVVFNHPSFSTAEFTLIDVQGKVIRRLEVQNGVEASLNREDLSAGTYLFELKSEGTTIETGRLILR